MLVLILYNVFAIPVSICFSVRARATAAARTRAREAANIAR